jgi:hypothetical protein
MKTLSFKLALSSKLPSVAMLACVGLVVACSGDDNAKPTKPAVVGAKTSEPEVDAGTAIEPSASTPVSGAVSTAQSSANATSNASGKSTAGKPESDAGTAAVEPVTDSGATPVEVDSAVVVEAQGCVENDEECFSCPETTEQFLHRCTDSQCKPFDNARLGRYVAGQALPPAP